MHYKKMLARVEWYRSAPLCYAGRLDGSPKESFGVNPFRPMAISKHYRRVVMLIPAK